jgi:nitrite reductase/ring-hydroxylating ferredoxin subunit/uncharacterized membrane protein
MLVREEPQMESARAIKRVVHTVEDQEWLEQLSDLIEENVVVGAYEKLGESQWPIRNVLHGSFLGHPLHPVISDVPTGSWTTAFVLDIAEALSGRKDLGPGADAAISLGLVASVPTALSGLADWKHTKEETQRTGLVHGLLNLAAVGFYLFSLLLRRAGARGLGQVMSTIGFGLVFAGAYLGGELVFDRWVGTSRVKEPEGPEDFTPIGPVDDLEEATPYEFEVDGESIVVVRSGGVVYALSDVCAHLGRQLSGGEVHDGCITCPAHGSTYKLENGAVVTGPAAYPQPVFDVRIRDGQVEIRKPS